MVPATSFGMGLSLLSDLKGILNLIAVTTRAVVAPATVRGGVGVGVGRRERGR